MDFFFSLGLGMQVTIVAGVSFIVLLSACFFRNYYENLMKERRRKRPRKLSPAEERREWNKINRALIEASRESERKKKRQRAVALSEEDDED